MFDNPSGETRLIHVLRVSLQISQCSPHRLIGHDTFQLDILIEETWKIPEKRKVSSLVTLSRLMWEDTSRKCIRSLSERETRIKPQKDWEHLTVLQHVFSHEVFIQIPRTGYYFRKVYYILCAFAIMLWANINYWAFVKSTT